MSVTQLFFVRHGETVWNAEGRMQGWANTDLNERGVAQAQSRSAEMIALNCDAAYSSTSARAQQTLHALLGGESAAMNSHEGLREISLGPWEGCLLPDIALQYPEQHGFFFEQPGQFALAGAETFAQLQARGSAAVSKIVENHPGQRVLIVSHGGMIKALLLQYLGWPLSQMWAEPRVANCGCSVVEHCADTGYAVKSISDQPL